MVGDPGTYGRHRRLGIEMSVRVSFLMMWTPYDPTSGKQQSCLFMYVYLVHYITIITIIIVFSIGMRRVPQDFRYCPRNEGTPRKDVWWEGDGTGQAFGPSDPG